MCCHGFTRAVLAAIFLSSLFCKCLLEFVSSSTRFILSLSWNNQHKHILSTFYPVLVCLCTYTILVKWKTCNLFNSLFALTSGPPQSVHMKQAPRCALTTIRSSYWGWGRVMVFNATFNNISVISWQSFLLVEETGVPEENHRPAASHWQTLSHNVLSSNDVPYKRCALSMTII
jgi:hypothetical protein